MSRIKATTRISDIPHYPCTLKPAVLNSYFFGLIIPPVT